MASRTEIAGEIQSVTREGRIRAAFFRGAELTLENPVYLRALRGIAGELLRQDTESGDVTVEAMGIVGRHCAVEIYAKEGGVVAGTAESCWLYKRAGVTVEAAAKDGDVLRQNELVMRVAGPAGTLFALERSVVNLLLRMSGIATAMRKLADLAQRANSGTHVVATRKTLWGLLDKRAVHCGGGGTHRLNLGDAVLIKTNHFRLASNSHGDFRDVIERAWKNRKNAKFFEVEASTPEEALKLAEGLSGLQGHGKSCPCILMLDNFSVTEAKNTIDALTKARLRENILVEASGKIAEESVANYAAAGVDVISVGALTHSSRALDLSAKLVQEMR